MSAIEPNMKYLGRIMEVLSAYDGITVTNLAMLSRMNHQRCSKLLAQMEGAGYVIRTLRSGRKYFRLTDSGKDSARRILDINQGLMTLLRTVRN